MPTAIRHLQELSGQSQKRITDKIDLYAGQQDPLAFAKHLVGYGAYRFRIGDYRVIFEVSSNTIYVLLIVKRDAAYKDL